MESSIYERLFLLTNENRSQNFKQRGRRAGMAEAHETNIEIMQDIDVMQQNDDINV
jgi:hypothetical protein